MPMTRIFAPLLATLLLALPAPAADTLSAGVRVERPAMDAAQAVGAVLYNTRSHKVHKPGCAWALRCTRHCVPTKRERAYGRGGSACRVCGG